MLLVFAEFLEVLGGGAAVAGRDLFGAGAADGAAGFVHLAAQFHFDLLGGGENGGLNALREHRVVGVGVGVELAELLNELADVVSGGRVIAVLLLELLQALEGVAVLGLVVGDLEVAEAGLGIDDTGAAIVGAAVIGSAIVAATAATLLSLTLLAVFGIVGAGAQSLLDLFQLVADLVEALGEIGFRHDGVFAETAPEVIGVALHVALHLRLLDAAEGFAHFGGGGAFGGLQVAGGGLHPGAELLEVVDFRVLLGSQLAGFLA